MFFLMAASFVVQRDDSISKNLLTPPSNFEFLLREFRNYIRSKVIHYLLLIISKKVML